MDLSVFCTPVDPNIFLKPRGGSLGSQIKTYCGNHFPDWKEARIALIGVQEDRLSKTNKGSAKAPDTVRKFLYDLLAPTDVVSMVDLGNVKMGATHDDTLYALRDICAQLIKNQVIPLVIGGSQDLTFAMYQSYEKLEQTVNLVSVDPRLDFGSPNDELSSENYLNKVVLHQPNYLFNYSNVGHQRYLVEEELLELMNKMFFDMYRLGYLVENIERAEPVVRNADLVSIDISAVRHSDAPGSATGGPNGLYGEELCQIAKYIGMSDKMSAVGFFEYNPEFDRREITGQLIAQAIWCLIEAVGQRKNDFPTGSKEDYLKYIVNLPQSKDSIVFFKSPKSDRWWMDVPYPAGSKNKYHRHHLVPCTYEDYQIATNEDMPDLWWKTYQKLT